MIADQPLAPFGVEPCAVEGDDAGRLLPAMLQGVQTEGHDRRRVGMAENAEDAAFLAQPVSIRIDVGCLVPVGGAVDGCAPQFILGRTGIERLTV